MLARCMVGEFESKKYEQNCGEYDKIIMMFRELGTGKISRRDVLTNITTMVENGLVERLETLVDDIEYYEER